MNNGAALLLGGTLVSRLLGFVRDLLTAALLGPAADAFVAAFRLPNVFRRLLAEGSLGLSLGAAAACLTARQSPEAARAFSLAVAARAFVLALAAALVLAVLARPLLLVLAPGLDAATAAGATLYLRLCLPYLPLCLFSSLAFAFAASQRDFRAQAFGPALLNAALILAACLALPLASGNARAASLFLCAGLLAGALAQGAAGLYCLGGPAAVGRGLRAAFASWRAAGAEAAFLRALPAGALGAAPHQLHVLAGLFFASLAAPGCISGLYFAERLVELPLGLAGAALGLALLPDMAGAAAAGDARACGRELARGLRLGAFFSLPAAAGLLALAGPLTDALFGRGAFGREAVELTAAALRGYALGLPALCAARPLISALHALGAGKAPLGAACASLVPLVLAGSAGALANGPVLQSGLIGLGLGAGAWCNFRLLLRHLGRAAPEALPPLAAARGAAGRYALLSLPPALALAFLGGGFPGQAASLFGAPALLGLVALCAAAWLELHYLAGNEDAVFIVRLLRRGQGAE